MPSPDCDVVGVGEEDDADGAPLLAVVHLVAPEYLPVPAASAKPLPSLYRVTMVV